MIGFRSVACDAVQFKMVPITIQFCNNYANGRPYSPFTNISSHPLLTLELPFWEFWTFLLTARKSCLFVPLGKTSTVSEAQKASTASMACNGRRTASIYEQNS